MKNSRNTVDFSKKQKRMTKKILRHAKLKKLHFFDGTQRFDEPVSNITEKGCGGVPILIDP